MTLEERIEKIEQRNKSVEADKGWETSWLRRGFITVITYLIAVWFMWLIGVENYCVGALVPTGGYILSTLSLPFLKKLWLKRK